MDIKIEMHFFLSVTISKANSALLMAKHNSHPSQHKYLQL